MKNGVCQKCRKRFQTDIQTYDENALYLDLSSEGLLIKTDHGAVVGCFYCFPARSIKDGFVFLRDYIFEPNQNKT